MSNVQKEKIVGSYAKILSDIILSHQDARQYFLDIKTICKELMLDKVCVNPINLNDYRNWLLNVKQNISNDDDFQKFLFLLLKRKYGALINDIVNKTERQISKKISTNNVVVNSKSELSNDVKKYINSVIVEHNNMSNVNIQYKTNINIKGDDIEIISNGKICVLDVKSAVKTILLK